MIVTIDGPAGAGKSTVAKELAKRLSFRFLDTGAMYRVVTLAVLRANLGEGDDAAVDQLAAKIDIQFQDDRVLLEGEDVSEAIRTPEVTRAIHRAADNTTVRAQLVKLQRREATGGNIVCEGRDQGTVAFPDAQCKIFLVASPQERALRRQADLCQRGLTVDLKDVLADQEERDSRDSARPVGALRKAEDAIEVCTDGLTINEVVCQLEAIVSEQQP